MTSEAAAADPSEVRSAATSITLPFRLIGAITHGKCATPHTTNATATGRALLQILTSLPSALAAASDREVLQVAASAVASLYPSLGYIR